jgi:hypothetical protein
MIYEKNLKQKIFLHCPFKAKHQRTQECTDVTSQNFTKIFSHPFLKNFHRNNSIYKITTPLLRSEGGNLQTDAVQLFRFDPIPAKAKKLGLLSSYKFSLTARIIAHENYKNFAKLPRKFKMSDIKHFGNLKKCAMTVNENEHFNIRRRIFFSTLATTICGDSCVADPEAMFFFTLGSEMEKKSG